MPMRTMGDRAGGGPARAWTAAVADEVLAVGDRVMHPAHGLGQVSRIGVESVSGFRLEFVHVAFDEARLTLRVPLDKVPGIGLRRLASRALIDAAFAVLQGRARPGRAVWGRQAEEYQAKINSGDPRVVAEVVRDLGRDVLAGGQSHAKRTAYETALDRLACEVAAVEGIGKQAAIGRINDQLAAAAA